MVFAVVVLVLLVALMSPSLMDAALAGRGEGIFKFAVWFVLIILAPVVLVLAPLWGPVWWWRRRAERSSQRREIQDQVDMAIALQGVRVSAAEKAVLVQAVADGNGTASQVVSDHNEARAEFQAALDAPFVEGSWFANELANRYLRANDAELREIARLLAAHDMCTNRYVREVLRRRREAWRSYYESATVGRPKPDNAGIVEGLRADPGA